MRIKVFDEECLIICCARLIQRDVLDGARTRGPGASKPSGTVVPRGE